MTSEGEQQEQGTHFWFMSLMVPLPTGSGFSTFGRRGHCTPKPGATRFEVFDDLLALAKQGTPELDRDAVVISFDIQPNQL